MIIHNRPITDFKWICDLDEVKGLDIGDTYWNTKYAKKFIAAIAEVQFNQVSELIKHSNIICIIGDSSNDSSVKGQGMWYARHCTARVIKVDFIGIESAEKASTENIVSGLSEIVSGNLRLEWPSFIEKTVAISCDGASVMVGCRNGDT